MIREQLNQRKAHFTLLVNLNTDNCHYIVEFTMESLPSEVDDLQINHETSEDIEIAPSTDRMVGDDGTQEPEFPVFFPGMKAATREKSEDNVKIRGLGIPRPQKDTFSSASDISDIDQRVEQTATQSAPSTSQAPSKKKFIWIIFGLLVALAVAVTIVLIFLLSKDSNEDNTNVNDLSSPSASPPNEPFLTEDDDLFAPVAPATTTSIPTDIETTTSLPATGDPITTPMPSAQSPVMDPTSDPTVAPTTISSTPTQTESPSSNHPSESPTAVENFMQTVLVSRLQSDGIIGLDGDTMTRTTRVNYILKFLTKELTALEGEEEEMRDFLQGVSQRYSILNLDWQLSGYNGTDEDSSTRTNTPSLVASLQNIHECLWPGVICQEGTTIVGRLEWGYRQPLRQDGERGDGNAIAGILGTEIGILQNLTYLDVSNNGLEGTIPDELYTLVNLEFVYLYKNRLSGTISSLIGNLWQLHTWHSSHNQFVGSIPPEIRSSETIRPLHTLNLYSNQMTGTFPGGLRLRRLFHLDLGRNLFRGQLPADFADKAAALRLFHIDHNSFSGEIPSVYGEAGSGRVVSYAIDNNNFTGRPPVEDLQFRNILVSYTMHNNSFTEDLDRDFCRQNVFVGGEMVEMKADCDICSCSGIFCDACIP